MNKEVEEFIKKLKEILNKKLENWELDKAFGQLSPESIYSLFPTESELLLNYINQLEKENQQLQNDLDSTNSKVSELANKLLQIETIIKYDLKYYEKDVIVRDLNTILEMIGKCSK